MPDEVFLGCNDGYWGLPSKVKAVIQWAYDNGYDHVLKCDDDVVLKPAELLVSGFNEHDFVGHKNYDPGAVMVPWGFCYWLSRKAMKIMLETELPGNNNDEAWVARTLHKHGIVLYHDHRYYLHKGTPGCIDNGRRALRKPKEYKGPPPCPPPEEGTFAFCMYIIWYGYRNMPPKEVLKEFRKVFEENREK